MILDNPSDPKNGFNQQVQIAYKGNSNWPTFGSTKFLERVAIACRLLDDWATDADVLWWSLWQLVNLSPVIPAVTSQTWNLPSNIFYLSDSVYILLPAPYPAGSFDQFQVVHPNRRNDNALGVGMVSNGANLPPVYLNGTSAGRSSNLILNFVNQLSTQEVGGTIQIGAFTMPTYPAAATDTIPVDNPMWLVWAVAAELARNDPSKQDQVPNLTGMANQAYAKMVTANQGNSFEQPNNPGVYNQANPGMNAPVYGAG